MKKALILLLTLLLSMAMLWGCSKEPGTETSVPSTTAPSIPKDLYYNLDKDAKLTPDANGNYSVRFLLGSEKKTYTVSDKALLDKLLLLDFVGLHLDGNKITGVVRMSEMPYRYVVRNHYVQSIEGNNVSVNMLPTFTGQQTQLQLTAGLPIYDLVPNSEGFGTATELQGNDCVTVVADESGKYYFAFVNARTAKVSTPHEGLLYCAHCKKEVSWLDWISTTTMPSSSGHYLLTENLTLTSNTNLGDVQICLDLNGKTVTQATNGNRIYTMASGGTLSIMDSAGGGTIIPNTTDEDGQRYGLVVRVEGTDSVLNLYGGTLDGSKSTAQTGCVISLNAGTFNMYGGTILGGTVYGTGSSAVSASGTFNMYDGKIVGGKHVSTDYKPVNPPGGGVIRVLGTTTIYGGTIEGGESYSVGGIIRVSPDAKESSTSHLIIKGGTITGGKGSQGSGIYVCAGAKITVSGDTKIIGNDKDNLYLEDGASFAIGEEGLGENAQIGISAAKAGEFVTGVADNVDLTKYIVSDDPAKKIVSAGNGSWSLE